MSELCLSILNIFERSQENARLTLLFCCTLFSVFISGSEQFASCASEQRSLCEMQNAFHVARCVFRRILLSLANKYCNRRGSIFLFLFGDILWIDAKYLNEMPTNECFIISENRHKIQISYNNTAHISEGATNRR